MTCRWGILSTGWIAGMFVKDLLVDPKTRGVSDVEHEVVAVGSRSVESAQKFVDEWWPDVDSEANKRIKRHGSYAELFRDEAVDCIYIGTPHSHHFETAYAALQAGKNVLVEKPITVNATQAETLVQIAREKGVFLASALWTRCLPSTLKLREVLDSGVIGEIRGVTSEFSIDATGLVSRVPGHRMVNPDLAGGALLDLGPYSYTQLALVLAPHGQISYDQLPEISSSMVNTSTGVDACTTAILRFKQADGRIVAGTMTSAIDRHTPPERCVLISGSLGYIAIHSPANNTRSFTVKRYGDSHRFWTHETEHEVTKYEFEMPGGIFGFAYEADEVARCLRDGKTESGLLPLDETVFQMKILDEIRRQNGLDYPERVESVNVS